jgi:hypothetical protein
MRSRASLHEYCHRVSFSIRIHIARSLQRWEEKERWERSRSTAPASPHAVAGQWKHSILLSSPLPSPPSIPLHAIYSVEACTRRQSHCVFSKTLGSPGFSVPKIRGAGDRNKPPKRTKWATWTRDRISNDLNLILYSSFLQSRKMSIWCWRCAVLCCITMGSSIMFCVVFIIIDLACLICRRYDCDEGVGARTLREDHLDDLLWCDMIWCGVVCYGVIWPAAVQRTKRLLGTHWRRSRWRSTRGSSPLEVLPLRATVSTE